MATDELGISFCLSTHSGPLENDPLHTAGPMQTIANDPLRLNR